MIILIPLIMLACFAFLGAAQDGGSLVDQYISESRGEVQPIFDTRFPSNPRDSRKLYEEREKNNSQTEVVEETAANEVKVEEVETPQTQAVQTNVSEVSGNWSFILKDSVERVLYLVLFQSDTQVLGQGTLSEGNTTKQVSATGQAAPGRMNLELIPSNDSGIYYITVDMGPPVIGSYTAYNVSGGQSWSGELFLSP